MRVRREADARERQPDRLTAAQLLWRHREFNKLWAGQGISTVGSQVTLLALPLTAVLYLHASTIQVGLLSAAGLIPYSGPSLLFGVLADRVRRRPLMIMADMGRTVVIALIPVLAWTHSLGMPVMYAVALIQGCLTVVFDVAYRSYLPGLVGKDALLAGNSRLQGTASLAQVIGPGLSGTLMELLGAPFALLVDAGSFVASWASLLWIRTPEPPPARRTVDAERGMRAVFTEIKAGLSFIYRNPVLRAVTGSSSIFNFFSQLQITLFLVYAPRVKHITAGGIGLIFVALGIGGVVGSLLVRRYITRFGYGPMLLMGLTLGAVTVLSIALVPGRGTTATAIYMVVYFICGYGLITLNIAGSTLRQIATPGPLQGRVNASFRFGVMALMPFSALLAGVLGDQFGLRPALFICSAGMPLSVIWICLSPTRKVRAAEDLITPEPEPQAAGPAHR
ncbi:MAG TPA: MFS transporter [Streptosporangiaceae bacterium]|jgi:MFS family permease|nr:MFS transporter [Streptosporangiaceae bacterium]